jgi:hypothetical protein
MRALLIILAVVMTLVGLLGCAYVAFGGIGIYMVLSGSAVPGEPMFLDELTPALADSVVQTAIGVVCIAGALFTRACVRRVLARMDEKQTGEA